MRLHSLLFIAVLSACLNTFTTRSTSTSVRQIASNQEDVPAQAGTETAKEERAFNLPGFGKPIDGINSMASKFAEKMLYWYLRASRKNAVEAYKFLQLNKDNSLLLRNVRSKVWDRYFAKVADSSSVIESAKLELSRPHGDENVLKVLEALMAKNVRKDIQAKLKTALDASWKKKNLPPRIVFMQLQLHAISSLNSSVYFHRLTIWIQYVESFKYPGQLMFMTLRRCDFDTRVRTLNNLYWNMDNVEHVQFAENMLLQGGYGSCQGQMFYEFSLWGGSLKTLLNHEFLEPFNKFAKTLEPAISKEASLIIASRQIFGDKSLLEMLEAASKKEIEDEATRVEDVTATSLLEELKKQGLFDAETRQFTINDDLKRKLESEYKTVVANNRLPSTHEASARARKLSHASTS